MKQIRDILIIAMMGFVAGLAVAWAADVPVFDDTMTMMTHRNGTLVPLGTIDSSPTSLVFHGDSGKEAIIDFSGDTVTYSGDLAVAESAKLFFEAFRDLCPKREE